MGTAEPTGTLILGAGAAGLAVAGVLTRRRLPYALLDRAEELGQSWRHRYDSLRLHTARRLSGLPGLAIPRRAGRWVGRAEFADYLQTYAETLGIEPELGVSATGLERVDGGWRVHTSAGDRSAARVVVATGYTHTPVLPDWPGRATFTGELLHARDYRRPDAYAGRDVLVVGAGNSATEIAVDLLEAARSVSLSVRTPPAVLRRAVLGLPSQLLGVATEPLPRQLLDPMATLVRRVSIPDLAPFGLPAPTRPYSKFLATGTTPVLDHGFVAAVRDRRITVLPPVETVVGDEVRLADQTIRYPDVVIAATGYRPALEPLLGGLGVLDERGLPTIHGGISHPGAPGLYVVGISSVLTGQLLEISREAEHLGAVLAR